MGITCQDQQTISAVSISMCGHLAKISNQRVGYSTIDIQIDSQIFPQVGSVASHVGNDIWTLLLISKNDGAGTAVLKFTISTDPCSGITCPDQCTTGGLQHYKCDVIYDSNNIPNGYQCVPDGSPIPNSPQCAATHNLDIYVNPHSWYTPGGAASWMTTHLADIAGAIVNGMTEAGLTNWTYLSTDIITETDRVIIRIYLVEVSSAPPFSAYPTFSSLFTTQLSTNPEIRTLVLGPWTIIAIAIGVVIIGIGIVVGYNLYKAAQILLSETYTKTQVGEYTNDILTKNTESCGVNFPNDPVGYANCVKSAIQAVTTAGGDFFNDPTITQSGQTSSTKIDTCITQYNAGQISGTDLTNCTQGAVKDTQSTIKNQTKPTGSPFGSVLLLGMGLVGLYVLTRPAEKAAAAFPVFLKEGKEK